MNYNPISVRLFEGDHKKRWDGWNKLFEICPGMRFYLKNLLPAYLAKTESEADAIIAKWESGAPRPLQRRRALSDSDDEEFENLILFGKESGVGKTTVAHELIWRNCVCLNGMYDDDWEKPLALTGHVFARKVAENARKLDSFMQPLLDAQCLLLDDLDKRGDSEGKFTNLTQQTLYDLIEARTTTNKTTIITMNSTGNEMFEKFDEEFATYILRRMRERFTSVNFDPVLEESNIVKLEGTA